MHILFVCTGNTCRSPMAEFYFRALCKECGRPEFSAGSAGISAAGGEPISQGAAAVLSLYGISSSGFRSRCLSAGEVEKADLILTMTNGHLEMVKEKFPQAKAKTRLLLEFLDAPGDIPDPYGGPIEQYQAVFETMRFAIDELAKSLFK